MIGNRILVAPYPDARIEEIIVDGTPRPGQFMGIKPGGSSVGGTNSTVGRHEYEPAGATAASGSRGMSADGDRIAVGILLGPGETAATPPLADPASYVFTDGERAAICWLRPGDLVNVLFQNAAGTADDVAKADKLIIDDGTGKVLVSTGAVESEPLEAREPLVDPTADTHILAVWCGM